MFEIGVHRIVRFYGVVEHIVHIAEAVGEVGVVGKADEDGDIVHVSLVGVLIAGDRSFCGVQHGVATGEILFLGDLEPRPETAFGGGIVFAGNIVSSNQLPFFHGGIYKIARFRILNDGIAVRVVQPVVEFIPGGETVQNLSVGLG